jgi:GNAT superfamily N-acetyltransferase
MAAVGVTGQQDVLIRKYAPGDLQACRDLWKELTDRHRQIYSDQSIGGPDPGAYFDSHLERAGPERIIVAESDSLVVGLAGLVQEGQEAELEPLIVTESHRNSGLGRRLVEAAIVEAKKLGVTSLSVRPVARNIEAIKFFRECGFVNIGHVEMFIDFSGRKWVRGIELHGIELNY